MSFPLLQEYIEKLDDEREVTLFLLAFLFKVMQTKSVKAWIRLADRFFATYSDELYRYSGYWKEGTGNAKIWVARPEQFISYMGAMMRTGIIGDCSFVRLASYIDLVFDTGNMEITLLNKLKEQNPEAETITNVMNADSKVFREFFKK